MADTSYNSDFAPYTRASLLQAPVPAAVHNLPASIAANSSATSNLIVTEGFLLIASGVTSSQSGALSIQRYIDAGGTVAQGAASSVNLAANMAATINITDGLPYASLKVTITNGTGSAAAISNFALLLQVSASNAPNPAIDGSTTITTGGTAQTLFSGTVPANGFMVCNPDATNDLWVSDTATAVANGQGCLRIAANGGYYATEPRQKPLGPVSIVGATTGQKITARRW